MQKINIQLMYMKKFIKIFYRLRGTKIIHKLRPKDLYQHLNKSTASERFDNIAGGVQIFVEELVKKLF